MNLLIEELQDLIDKEEYQKLFLKIRRMIESEKFENDKFLNRTYLKNLQIYALAQGIIGEDNSRKKLLKIKKFYLHVDSSNYSSEYTDKIVKKIRLLESQVTAENQKINIKHSKQKLRFYLKNKNWRGVYNLMVNDFSLSNDYKAQLELIKIRLVRDIKDRIYKFRSLETNEKAIFEISRLIINFSGILKKDDLIDIEKLIQATELDSKEKESLILEMNNNLSLLWGNSSTLPYDFHKSILPKMNLPIECNTYMMQNGNTVFNSTVTPTEKEYNTQKDFMIEEKKLEEIYKLVDDHSSKKVEFIKRLLWMK